MTYRIAGLDPATLDISRAIRVTADTWPGYPCRVTLEDAPPGETVLLFNHVSHDVATPFRSSYAIYVREGASPPPVYQDELPRFLTHRTLGLHAFDADGMLRDAAVAGPGAADAELRRLFARPGIAYVHIHNAGAGCFLAAAVSDDDR